MTGRPGVLGLVTTAVLLSACTADPGSVALDKVQEAARGESNGRACDQAREVTATFTDAINSARTPADGRNAVAQAVSGLRDIEAEPPVDMRVRDLESALSDVLRAVDEEGQLDLGALEAEVSRATTALAEDCGSTVEPR